MGNIEFLKIVDSVAIIMLFFIVLVYGLSAYWNFRFIIKTKWQYYTGLKLYTALVSTAFVIVYLYLIINFIRGKPVDISLFGSMVVRPLVLLMGGSLASSARARYTQLISGGEKWILRKSKTS